MPNVRIASSLMAVSLFILTGKIQAQDRVRTRDDRDWDQEHNRYTRLTPGTIVAVRPTESIDVERKDSRVYRGIVDQDVRGENGRVAIPRGSSAELIVRVDRDNDLVLDLESVTVNGQRYAIRTDAKRVESARDNSLVGAIIGAVGGGQARGRAVRIPRDSLLTFRIERPLEMGVSDRGVDRNGNHYHEWYDKDR